MSKFDKQELATRFFSDGRECIKSADILFHDKERGSQSQFGILLIHGIELLLKAYLLLKNSGLVDDPAHIDIYLRKLGHKYKDIYDECQKYGAELNDKALEVFLDSLRHTYYEDSVDVRYIQESGVVLFDPAIFATLTGRLIKPIHSLLFPKTPFMGDYGY